MAVIGRAFIELAVETGKFRAGIEEALQITARMEKGLSRTAQNMVKGFENALNPATKLAEKLEILEAAGKSMTDISLVMGKRIDDTTEIMKAHGQVLPEIVKRYSEMREAAAKLQGSTEDVASSIGGLTNSQRDAKDAIGLLGNQLGIQLPREVEKFLASTSLIGPAMATAFKASIFIALGVALFEALNNMDKLTDKVFDWTGAMKEAQAQLEKTNGAIVEHNKKLVELQRANELAGLSGTARAQRRAGFGQEDVGVLESKLSALLETRRTLSEIAKETKEVAMGTGEAEPKIFQIPTEAATQAQGTLKNLNNMISALKIEIKLAEEEMVGFNRQVGEESLKAAEQFAKAAATTEAHMLDFFRARHTPQGLDALKMSPGLQSADPVLVNFDKIVQDRMKADQAARAALGTTGLEEFFGKTGELFESVDSTWIKINDQHRERYQKMIDTVRDGAGQVFDALLTKGKGVFSSLLNFVNGLLQTMGRKIFQNMAAMVFGGKKGGIGSIFEGVFPGFSAGGAGGSPAATGINGGTFGKISGGLGGFFKNIFSRGGSTSAATASLGASGDWAGSLNNVSQGKPMAAGISKAGSAVSMAGMAVGMALFQSGMNKGSKLMTTIGGAATGASVGFQVGGPMGAAIGAGIGAIGGFVAGIFGSAAARRRQEIVRIEESIKAYEALRAPTIGALGESLQGRGLSVGLRDGVRVIRWDRLEAAIEKLTGTVDGFGEAVMNFETLSPGVVVKRGADGASREILAAADQGMQNNRSLRLSFARTVLEET